MLNYQFLQLWYAKILKHLFLLVLSQQVKYVHLNIYLPLNASPAFESICPKFYSINKMQGAVLLKLV